MRARSLVPFLFALGLFGCAELATALGVAAPIAADALASYQARARQLAPTLPAGDPRLDAIADRLAVLEASRAREESASKCEADAQDAGAAALVAALEEAARAKADATRARDALAAALRAIPLVPPAAVPLPSSVLPFVDASAPDAPTALPVVSTDSGAP